MLELLYEKYGASFESGEMIFCEYEPGEECYFILEGKVKIIKTLGNTQKTLDIIEAGSFFGEMAILESAPRSASAVALEDVRLLQFNNRNFDIMIRSHPQLALRLLLIFSSRIYDAKRRLQILLLDDLSLRVCDVFVMLAEKDPSYGKISRMVFQTNVDDIAAWSGLSSGDVQNVLHDLSRKDKLELFADRIVIRNINDFIRLVTYHRKNL